MIEVSQSTVILIVLVAFVVGMVTGVVMISRARRDDEEEKHSDGWFGE